MLLLASLRIPANVGCVLTYLEKALRESLKYQPETYELETENGVTIYFLIACGNTSQYGNNAYINAPQATLTNGLLEWQPFIEPFTVFLTDYSIDY